MPADIYSWVTLARISCENQNSIPADEETTMLAMTTKESGICGVKDVADAIGGGINEKSLFLIEGESDTGKSVVSQHIAYGVLNSKETKAVYYSTEHNAESLIEQMETIGLDVARDVIADRFRIYRVGTGAIIRDPEAALQGLINHITGLPKEYQLIFFDSPSWFLNHVKPEIKLDFLYLCKEMSEERSIVLVLDTHVFEADALGRAYAVSDYYLRLRSHSPFLENGQIDPRVIKKLEVTKLAGARRYGDEGFKFEIKPNVGIQILPFVKVRV